MSAVPLGWLGIVRLGLVQTALGAVVVIMTSTINRVMVVELALPAFVPGLLVASHYGVQILRPAWGYGSDSGGRRTPWILGGMAALSLGGAGAAIATALASVHLGLGLALAAISFLAIGAGVGAAGTSVLAMLATNVAPERRAAAATMVWVMMIFGFALTAPLAGHFLDPFSNARLIAVTISVCALAFILAASAVYGLEGATPRLALPAAKKPPFAQAFGEVWAEPAARQFTIFIFVSMLAYSAQELLIEPYAGLVFGMTPGVTTKLAGIQHGGVLAGMIGVALSATLIGGPILGSLRLWTVAGCLASALSLVAVAASGVFGPTYPLRLAVFALGASNGAFAVAAIGSMMGLAGSGARSREGMRMGLWGASQAVAFGLGGFLGAAGADVARHFTQSPVSAYGIIFFAEALLFLVAAALANRIVRPQFLDASQSIRVEGGDMTAEDIFDVVVVGGGPSGATVADDLARKGRRVLLLDKGGRIKPCGGAIPPRLMRDFEIPASILKARVDLARMISPSAKSVDMPIAGGYVGMVDRADFDEWLRLRAQASGAVRRTGQFEKISRDNSGWATVHYTAKESGEAIIRARLVIGADGALSQVGRQEIPGADKTRFVFAYHEIVRAPSGATSGADAKRCEIYYRGALSPDFYAWVFPHGDTMSVGTGSAQKGFSLKTSVRDLRALTGLDCVETVRREGAPIPLKPLRRWDNGRDVLVAGDAAGIVAPASGEGIYYAMLGGRLSADAAHAFLTTGDPLELRQARKRFMKAHGRVFWILGMMQYFWYSNDKRRERFVSICRDPDVQRLTWEAYMNIELVRADPMAHVRIFFKDLAHLFRLVTP